MRQGKTPGTRPNDAKVEEDAAKDLVDLRMDFMKSKCADTIRDAKITQVSNLKARFLELLDSEPGKTYKSKICDANDRGTFYNKYCQ